jgi:hypothetical protein
VISLLLFQSINLLLCWFIYYSDSRKFLPLQALVSSVVKVGLLPQWIDKSILKGLREATKIFPHTARPVWLHTSCTCHISYCRSKGLSKNVYMRQKLTCDCTPTQRAYRRVLAGLQLDTRIPTSWCWDLVWTAGYCCHPLLLVHSGDEILKSSVQ